MKKTMLFSLIGGLAVLAFLAGSCTKEDAEIQPSSEEVGYLQLSLGLDVANAGGRVAAGRMADDEVSTDTWNVIIYDSTGAEVLTFVNYADVPDNLKLFPGSYTVVTLSDNNSDEVAFSNPHYYGAKDFVVVSNNVTSVIINAALTNVRISVAYSDSIKSTFDNYYATVTSASGELSFDSTETRSGYFPADEDLTVTGYLIDNSGGSPLLLRVSETLTGTKANEHYLATITMVNGFSPITIVIDSVVEVPVNISTPDPSALTFSKSFGGSSDDGAQAIHPTTDGGYIVAGYSTSSNGDITARKGSYDYWIAKLDGVGNLTWQKSLGGSGDDYAQAIQQTTDGGYIVAGYSLSTNGDITAPKGNYDYWIVKLNGSGNLTWQKSLGGSSDDRAFSIQQTTDGGYIVAGYSSSTNGDVTGRKGNYDYWIVKLTSSGNLTWQKSLGGSSDDRTFSIQQTTDGGYIVAGYSFSTNGDIKSPRGGYDYWIVKLNSTGSIAWQRSLGGSNYDYAQSIQQTTDGGYIVAGYSSSANGDITAPKGNDDYWIVKLDGLGNLLWQKSLGGSGFDRAQSIQQTTDGGYIVAGYSSSANGDITDAKGGNDYWIVKLDASGNLTWQKSRGGASHDYAQSIQQTTDGGYVIAGSSSSANGDITGAKGSSDYWIIKLDGVGNF